LTLKLTEKFLEIEVKIMNFFLEVFIQEIKGNFNLFSLLLFIRFISLHVLYFIFKNILSSKIKENSIFSSINY